MKFSPAVIALTRSSVRMSPMALKPVFSVKVENMIGVAANMIPP